MGWDWNIKVTSEVRPARSWNKSRCAMDIEHCLWDHCQFPPDLAFNCLIPDNAGYPSDYKCGTIFAHLLLTETVLPQKVANALSVETLRRRGISLDRIGSDIPWPYWIGYPLTVLDRTSLDRIGSNILWPYWIGIPWPCWIGYSLTVLDRISLDRIGSDIDSPLDKMEIILFCTRRWRFWIIIWLKHPFSKQIANQYAQETPISLN